MSDERIYYSDDCVMSVANFDAVQDATAIDERDLYGIMDDDGEYDIQFANCAVRAGIIFG